MTHETFKKWLQDRKERWENAIDEKLKSNVSKGKQNKWGEFSLPKQLWSSSPALTFTNAAGLTGREILTADASVGVDDSSAVEVNDYETSYQNDGDHGNVVNTEENEAATSSAHENTVSQNADELAERADASLYLDDDDDELSDIE